MKASIALKKSIFEKCLSLKNEELAILKESQRQQLESLVSDDIDMHNLTESPKESLMQGIDPTTTSLEYLINQINILKDVVQAIESKALHKKVSLGSLVMTSIGNFLIAVAQNKFQVQDETYQGISVQSPLFKKIEGLSAGDKFDNKQVVIKVF